MAARLLEEIIRDLKAFVPDDDGLLDSGDYTAAVLFSLRALSRKKPKLATSLITGSAWTFSLPSDFEEGFSVISAIIHPYKLDTEPNAIHTAEELDQSSYWLYKTTAGATKLGLKFTLAASEKALLQYTIPHSVGETSSTITNRVDEDSVIFCACGLIFKMLGGRAQQTTNAFVEAERINYQSIASGYFAQAENWFKMSGLKDFLIDLEVAMTASGRIHPQFLDGGGALWPKR